MAQMCSRGVCFGPWHWRGAEGASYSSSEVNDVTPSDKHEADDADGETSDCPDSEFHPAEGVVSVGRCCPFIYERQRLLPPLEVRPPPPNWRLC